MNRIYVRPAPGLQVRDPLSRQPLPDEGQLVEETSFWVRRLADGDVVLSTPPAPKAETVKK